jgi:hypothetical protein
VHRVDPIGDRGVDFLHSLGEQVVVLAENLPLRFVVLGLVALGKKGGETLLLVGLHLDRVILGLLLLTLLFLVARRIDR